MGFGPRQLQPDDRGKQPTKREKYKGGCEVALADLLVIDCRQPADDAGPPAPRVGEPFPEFRVVKAGIALIGRAGHRSGGWHHCNPMR